MKKIMFIAFALLITTLSYAQYNGRKFSLGINAVYTTTAKLYLFPNSSDQSLRNNYFELSGIVNPSAELRYALTDNIFIGIGSEYMKDQQAGRNLTVFTPGNQTETIEVQDGFSLIPVELSAWYLMPFSTERFKFLMGGGAGFYYGSHIRKFGDTDVSTISRKAAYGIHVIISMDYLLRDNVAISGQMKFRDPQFTVTNKYNKREVMYEGEMVFVPQETFTSKINVDGVTFLIGLSYNF